jgi:CDP-glucose 4,6-dehydratase
MVLMDSYKQTYAGKKVLLTGDTGFKGSWMAIWLTEMGAEVIGYALPVKTADDNFAQCNLSSKYKHIDGDIRDYALLKKTVDAHNPDIAFHLAAQPLVVPSYTDPLETYSTNVMGTANFLQAIRNTTVKAAVVITTDKCYENKEWVYGYRESDRLGGHDPYSNSKACAELVTESFRNSFFEKEGTCLVASARAGNVIGGGDWAEMRIVPDFFRAYKDKVNMSIRNPHATRPWQHVLEPVNGYLRLGQELWNGNAKAATGWNFGPYQNNHTSVGELISHFQKEVKVEVEYPENKHAVHEANLLKLDISKAVSELKWKPKLDMEATVAFTTKGYLDEINEGDLYPKRVAQILDFCNK